MSKKCTPLWREAHFEVKMLKTPGVRTTVGGSDVVSRGRCKGLCTLSKVSKTWGFCSISKSDRRRGTFEEDLPRCIFRGRRSTRDIFTGAVRRWGRWFPEKGCILEHQIFRFAEMILRDRRSTSYLYLSIYPSIHPSIYLSLSLSVYLSVYLSTYLSASLKTKQFCETSSNFELNNVKKRNNSARLLHFLNLTTSKTKQFCETSFKNWKLSAELTASYQCFLRFFHSTCRKYCACHKKVMPSQIER